MKTRSATPTPIAGAAAAATDPSPSRRELAGEHGVQRRAELAVERLGLELGVDGLGLVFERLWTLRVGARARPLDHGLERAFELDAVVLGGEDVGDPDVGAALRCGDAERPARRRVGDRRQANGDRDQRYRSAHDLSTLARAPRTQSRRQSLTEGKGDARPQGPQPSVWPPHLLPLSRIARRKTGVLPDALRGEGSSKEPIRCRTTPSDGPCPQASSPAWPRRRAM